MKLRISAIGVGALALASSVTFASAHTIVVRRAVPQRATILASAQGPQHRYFGALRSVSGQMLTIQLRNGRLLLVNATQAFALQRVSEPFFLGKPTIVDGTLGAGGVLNAVAVKRGASLPLNWGLDR